MPGRYHLAYRTDTDYGARFPTTLMGPTGGFPTREAAEDIRQACVNAESIEVVER